jgi:hypothetical protein
MKMAQNQEVPNGATASDWPKITAIGGFEPVFPL